MIKLVKYDDLTLFKKDVIYFLEKFEAENNLILGVLLSLSEIEDSPLLMATVGKHNDIGLVLLQTHPSQIILSKSVSFTSKEIHVIGEKLSNTIQEIPGFIGEKKLTTDLAMYISKLKGIQASVIMDQKIYKLEKVVKKANTNGMLRRIIEKDHRTIKEWVYLFCYETNQPISLDEADKRAKIMINKGNFVAWVVNGELVSMAYATRPTQNNITISYVYTPISERKKGYAADCVSAFTQSLLDRGYKTTSLYTDLNNPTSNKIYIQIGYEAIMDSIVILFK
ncbi:GNAT family N-acetyltransferase [Neobacillus massiliamazoniensis]|uniref:Acetyltransferase n=1 Tax=Neobacillus massiliamazoniensis TaxID=1499688 RepID=A0A0U1NZD0_9BACI|nr:GNAT family N-acetyltransferase [Neobacillus massiliamazoniensis]CRK83371.1 acetyltransferase [Neobacillus massiliamazoniensis]